MKKNKVVPFLLGLALLVSAIAAGPIIEAPRGDVNGPGPMGNVGKMAHVDHTTSLAGIQDSRSLSL